MVGARMVGARMVGARTVGARVHRALTIDGGDDRDVANGTHGRG